MEISQMLTLCGVMRTMEMQMMLDLQHLVSVERKLGLVRLLRQFHAIKMLLKLINGYN